MASLMLAILCLAACLARCNAGDTTFLIPPNVGVENQWGDNPQYRIGDAINVTWVSDREEVDLILEIQFPNEPDAPGKNWDWIMLQRSLPTSHYRWIVDLGSFESAQKVLDETGLVVLFLLVSPPGAGTTYIGRSHYFNVTDPRQKETSTIVTSTAAPTTSVSSTGTPASVSPASITAEASTAATSHSTNDNSPSTLVIGAAVGGSLGGLIILGGFGLLAWWLARKGRTAAAKNVNGTRRSYNTPVMEKQQYYVQPFGPAEFQSAPSKTVHELP